MDVNSQYLLLQKLTSLHNLNSNPAALQEQMQEVIVELTNLIPTVNSNVIEMNIRLIGEQIINTFENWNKSTCCDQNRKCLITDLLKIIFDKIKINCSSVFYYFYYFLLHNLSGTEEQSKGANICEEYKLSMMTAMVALLQSLTSEARKELYIRKNIPSVAHILHISIQLAKDEKLRSLRLACINCIMSVAQVHDGAQVEDIAIKMNIADSLMFFSPGIITGLVKIAIEDEMAGHKVISLAIQAAGRILALQMYNYNNLQLGTSNFNTLGETQQLPQNPFENRETFQVYLQNHKRNAQWYEKSDVNCQKLMMLLKNLTFHSHPKVRLELVYSCILIIENCAITLPNTVSQAIEILINLSEDKEDEVSNTSKVGLIEFRQNLPADIFKDLLEKLEEDFFTSLSSIPRIFNSYDEHQQLSSLNLVVGYLRLFGSNLQEILRSAAHLKRLLETLIHILQFDRKDVRLFEEYAIQDLRLETESRTLWKNFLYFQSEDVQHRIETLCGLLAELNSTDEVTDILLDIFINQSEKRREATFILNNVLYGIPEEKIVEHKELLKTVINVYMDPGYWKLPIEVSYQCLMPQVQYNIIQICVQVDGISKIASKLREHFKPYLLKTLYPILELAGSTNSLIKIAGATAIASISKACGYSSITSLINENCDYFSFHVSKKIYKDGENTGVLSVLTTVVKFCDISVLPTIEDIIFEILSQTHDKYFREDSVTPYLHLFEIFIESLKRWLSIDIVIDPIESKRQLEEEHEAFQISNFYSSLDSDDDDDYDSATDKTVEEMFKEDFAKMEQEEHEYVVPEDEEKQQPKYKKLTAAILKRCLHFLPSKDKSRKLLVLDILINGLEIIRDWENELLPIVHAIWSPLVQRFKETDDSLIVNRSFQLLVTLARLSKYFICSRTVKDVLPHILSNLKDLVEHSYLKDHGASYRYTQAYKLQINMLQQLSRIIINLEMADSHIDNIMKTVVYYLSNKQPKALQEAAVSFYLDLIIYDRVLVTTMLEEFSNSEGASQTATEYGKNVELILKHSTTE